MPCPRGSRTHRPEQRHGPLHGHEPAHPERSYRRLGVRSGDEQHPGVSPHADLRSRHGCVAEEGGPMTVSRAAWVAALSLAPCGGDSILDLKAPESTDETEVGNNP